MSRAILLGFALLIGLDTAAQVLVKIAGERISAFEPDPAWLLKALREPLIYGVMLVYAAVFCVYITLLKHAPVGPSFAAAHGHIVTVLVISILFFGEQLTVVQALGALAIIAGVLLLAVTETSHQIERPRASY
jgi:drug/metabolite transporter (DMT)-like permease